MPKCLHWRLFVLLCVSIPRGWSQSKPFVVITNFWTLTEITLVRVGVVMWSERGVCWTQNECFVIKRSRTKWKVSELGLITKTRVLFHTHDTWSHDYIPVNTSFILAVSPRWWVQMHRGQTMIFFTDLISCDQLFSRAIFYVSTSVVVLWSVATGDFCDNFCLITYVALCHTICVWAWCFVIITHPWWHREWASLHSK